MDKVDFFQELTEYTGRNRRLVEERCKTAAIELAWIWEKYKDDPIAYYGETDLYIFDLSNYQAELQNKGFHWLLLDMLKKYQCKTILDFGGGIGHYTILAFQNGMKADFLEIEGSKTLEYAKWRFKKYGVNPEIFTEKTDLTGRKYDCLVAMDVFEHIDNPEPIIKKLSTITKYLFTNLEDGLPYTPIYPQHISKYELEPYFKRIDRYMWEVVKAPRYEPVPKIPLQGGGSIDFQLFHPETNPDRLFAIKELGDYKDKIIIDVGCGGHKTIPEAIGVDILPGVDVQTSAENLYFAGDNTVDFIIARHIFEHLIDPVLALEEWRRVLKVGGKIIFVLPDHSKIDTMYPAVSEGKHLHAYTPDSLKRFLGIFSQLKVSEPVVAAENWSFGCVVEKKAKQKVAVFSSVYNEEKKIGEFVKRNLAFPSVDSVWIGDNGSTDKTVEIARKAGAHVLENAANFKGKDNPEDYNEWPAKQIALDFAKQSECEWMLYLDSDEILEPEAEWKLKRLIKSSRWDVYRLPLPTFWLGREFYRTDGVFGEFFITKPYKAKLFRRGIGAKMSEVRKGRHSVVSYPAGSKITDAELVILHYSFDSREEALEKYNRYKKADPGLDSEYLHPDYADVKTEKWTGSWKNKWRDV